MKLRSMLGPIIVTTVIVFCAVQIAHAQVDWTYDMVVVEPGLPGSWNEGRHMIGEVVFDGSTYHMYLVGGPGNDPINSAWSVGHWTATDIWGPWTPDPCNPVLEPQPGSWDAFSIGSVAVHYDGATFHLWYSASVYHEPIEVGYATNTDGAWYMNFSNGYVDLFNKKFNFYVWCVRGGHGHDAY